VAIFQWRLTTDVENAESECGLRRGPTQTDDGDSVNKCLCALKIVEIRSPQKIRKSAVSGVRFSILSRLKCTLSMVIRFYNKDYIYFGVEKCKSITCVLK
jgi:hypothetical protein